MQWHTLLVAMRIYQDIWVGQARGRAMRAAECRQILSQYLITPADARRSGIEFVMPGERDDDNAALDAGNVASLAERRRRLLEDAD